MSIAAAALFSSFALLACGGGDDEQPQTSTTTATATPTATSEATPTPSATSTSTPAATVEPTATPPTTTSTPRPDQFEPLGFPLPPTALTGIVQGAVGDRIITWGEGPPVSEVSASLHVSDDPVVANAAGWNCRVHVAYEGVPAVDWYVPAGTPVYATLDGTATLYVNTITNAFDYYGVDREPYIGNPDPANAPLSPFPGPGGGQGVFVRVSNSAFSVDFGHLLIGDTAPLVPSAAWLGGFGPGTDWAALYAVPQDFRVADAVATWDVRAGDLIGYTGDAGYSEAPHLHYAITRLADGARLCATAEAGFGDGSWLWR